MAEGVPHYHVFIPVDRETIEDLIINSFDYFVGPLKEGIVRDIAWIDGLPRVEVCLTEQAYHDLKAFQDELSEENED